MTNKYKDREPNETIKIIKKFFQKNKFEIIETLGYTGTSVKWVHLELYYNNIFIQSSNGKATDIEYAKASGYAELYERFCARIAYFFACENYKSRKNIYLKNMQYKTLDINNFSRYIKTFTNNQVDPEIPYDYFNYLANNELYEIEYKNIVKNTSEYWDIELLKNIIGSNGLCCGNSFYEALNQGISELVERQTIYDFIDKKIQFKKISSKIISSYPYIQKIIKEIEANNFNVICLDFSVSKNFPVVATIIFNEEYNKYAISHGCFPIFRIALERSITESLQGINLKEVDTLKTIPTKNIDKNEMKPSLNKVNAFFKNNYFIDINNILNTDEINHINSDAYILDEKVNNAVIFDYWIKKGFNIYYKNISLDKEIFTFQIIIKELLFEHTKNILNASIFPNEEALNKIDTFIHKIKNFDLSLLSDIKDEDLQYLLTIYIQYFFDKLSIPNYDFPFVDYLKLVSYMYFENFFEATKILKKFFKNKSYTEFKSIKNLMHSYKALDSYNSSKEKNSIYKNLIKEVFTEFKSDEISKVRHTINKLYKFYS